jgi:hypothetical protein
MTPLQDRRVLIGAGAAVAVAAGIGVAMLAGGKGEGDKAANTAAGEARGLQVEVGAETKLDPSRTLRCFVGGQFVGLATLADCAKKNGVAAQNLDVGLDQTGELAAAAGDTPLQPAPPPAPAAPDVAPAPVELPPAAPAPTADCMRYEGGGWRDVGRQVTLNACVQTLFQGRCYRPNELAGGRWGSQALRLAAGRVEMAPDNRNFHMIAEQNDACQVAPVQP